MSTEFKTTEGAALHYGLSGAQDAVTVVLVHGASQSSVVWREQAPLLVEAGFRCLLVDLPGHGASSPLPQPPARRTAAYDIARYARAVAELVESVSDEPVILVGHSMAGGVVLQVALDHPGAVAGVILMDSTSFSTGYSEQMLTTVGLNVTGWLEVNYRALCSRSTPRARVDEAVAALHATAEATMWNDMLAFAGLDLRPRLGELQVPVGFIHGREDWSVSVEMAEATRALCVSAATRIEVLEHVGHFPQIEAPERLGPMLVEMLGWVEASGGLAAAAAQERS